jgi:hypothetical protein
VIETSPSIENLAAALGKFQAETHGVLKDASNPFFKSRYATLEAVIETARPGLAKVGLAFLQAPKGQVGMTVELETMLMHGASGEWVRFSTVMPLPKADPQGVGSAITYACRYALMAMLGLPPLDDDAEATKPQLKQPQQPAIMATAQDLQFKPQTPPTESQSKKVYIDLALKRMEEIDSTAALLRWAKEERVRVWPQYQIDPHDPDGQRLVSAYKERMAVLTDDTNGEVSE